MILQNCMKSGMMYILSKYEEFSENDLAKFKVSKKKFIKIKTEIKVTC